MRTPVWKTLSVRLSLWMVTFAALLFVTVLWIMLWFARQAVQQEAMEKARATLDSAALTIDNELAKVETATRNMLLTVTNEIGDPDRMMELSRLMVEVNPTVEGCAIAFRPGFYPKRGELFMAYYHRVGNTIIRSDHFGDIPYTEQEWFSLPLQNDREDWADPLPVSKFYTRPITTYSVPIRQGGVAVGVLAIDIPLDWLSRTIQDARPFPNTYCALVNQNGSFIVHPNWAMQGPGSVGKLLAEHPNPDGELLANAMLSGQSGSVQLEVWGRKSYVFYRPFDNPGWSLGIVVPEEEIFESFRYLHSQAVVLTFAGLLVMLIFCFVYIAWQLRPLFRLDASTRRLADGHFDSMLEPTDRRDEIGHMQRAFREMQHSLSLHLDKIALQRKTLEEQGDALREAYEHSQEADKAKTAFIHSVTSQLATSVAVICDLVGHIHQEHAHLNCNDIEEMTERMFQQTNIVTDLLNRMISFSFTPKS